MINLIVAFFNSFDEVLTCCIRHRSGSSGTLVRCLDGVLRALHAIGLLSGGRSIQLGVLEKGQLQDVTCVATFLA